MNVDVLAEYPKTVRLGGSWLDDDRLTVGLHGYPVDGYRYLFRISPGANVNTGTGPGGVDAFLDFLVAAVSANVNIVVLYLPERGRQ